MATSVEEHEAKKWSSLLSAVMGTTGARAQGSQDPASSLPSGHPDQNLDADSIRAKLAVRKLQKLQRLVSNMPRRPQSPGAAKDFQAKLDRIPLPKE